MNKFLSRAIVACALFFVLAATAAFAAEPNFGSCPPLDPNQQHLTDCCAYDNNGNCTNCCSLREARRVIALAVGISVGVLVLCVLLPVLYCCCVGAACFAASKPRETVVYHRVA